MFTTDFPGAVIREGADGLTLRAHEEGVLHTFIVDGRNFLMGASVSRCGLGRFFPCFFQDN